MSRIPCPHFEECSGCPKMDLLYKDQLAWKESLVLDAFLDEGFGETSLKRLQKKCVRSPKTLGYRNKAKLILQRDAKGELKMGIYKQGTHEVVDIPECSVHAPQINQLAASLRQGIEDRRVPIIGDESSAGVLRYAIIRYSFRDSKLMLVLVTSQKTVRGLSRLVQELRAEYGGRLLAIVQNINDDPGNVLLGEANRFLHKKGELSETLGSFRVSVGPLSFLQVNSLLASKLYKRVQALIGRGPFERGLDLYSGIGLMGMHQHKSTEHILCVEEVGPAALEGVTAARRAKIPNVLHLCADAKEGIVSFHREWGAPDWVVLNPPRKGCEESVLRSILSKSPKKIVYVSCSPKTLARDCRILVDGGFRIKSIEPFDMFPQTAHVETLVSLERSRRKSARKKKKRAGASSRGSKSLH